MISAEQFVDAIAARLVVGRASAEQAAGSALCWIRVEGVAWRVAVVDNDYGCFVALWWPNGPQGVPVSRTVTDDPAMVRRLAEAARAAGRGAK